MRRVRGAAWCALFLFAGARVEAQTGLTGAALEGTVTDPGGQPLPGASVQVSSTETGLVRRAATDEHGRYSVAVLPSGTYRLAIEHPGYPPFARDRIVARVGEVLSIDVTLTLVFAEAVAVEISAGEDDRAGAGVSSIVGGGEIEGLPTNGRDYVAFTLLTPGVVAERTPPTGPTMSSGLSFAGQRARSNHVMVDGFDNDEVFTGAVAASFSQDSVLEFQVIAASAGVEFGHASGGTVNTVTRSGTNDLHGGAYLFFRDDALNAREHVEKYDVFGNPIDTPKAPFRQEQWGATLGGPLRKDRTFFFLSYEQLDRDANNFVSIAPAVLAALEEDDVPADVGAAPYTAGSKSALLRLDHGSSSEHRLLFRVHYSRRSDESVEPFGGIVARSHGVVQRREDWGIALGSTDVFGSGFVSEARLLVVKGAQTVRSLDPRCGEQGCNRPLDGGPEVTISGLAVAGRQLNTPQDRGNLALQLSETVTWSRGRHTWKAGLDLDLGSWDGVLAQDFGGRYIFTALPATPGVTPVPLSAFEAFQQGLPALYFQGYGNPATEGSWRQFSFFGQEHWRVSPRLEVTAGLRYQRYDLRIPSLTVSAPGGTNFTYDVPAGGNLAPRVSLSFDPTGRGRTTLRASAGAFHEDPLLAVALVSQIVNGEGLRLSQARLPRSAEAWRAPDRRLPPPGSPFPSIVQVAGPGFRAPYARQLAAGVTQELGRDLRLTADFIAVRGYAQIGIVDYNPMVPSLGAGRRPNDAAGEAGTSASVNQFTNFGESSYHGLAVSLHKRMSRGFEAVVSYTFSSAEDEGSEMFGQGNVAEDSGLGRDLGDPAGFPVGFVPAGFRGPAAVDQRHRFVLSGLVDLPGRIRLSGIVTLGSGRPFTALSGTDSNGNGVAATDRARRDPRDPASRVGRNSERLPGTATLDARLSRRVPLSRRLALDLVVEAFNLTNRVNYSEVNNVFGPGAFPDEPQRDPAGRVTYGLHTKTLAPRQVQLAARILF
jgi:hypothetical protein